MIDHIAFIMDGNRRWAIENKLKPWKGHSFGAEKFEKFIEWCVDLKIPQVSAYVLSTENLNRSKMEVDALLDLFQKELEKLIAQIKQRMSDLEKKALRDKVINSKKQVPNNN